MAIRERTHKLRDKWTHLPREVPKEADDALDFFQRTFPEVTTEEHRLIERWEDLVDVFGGTDAATDLVLEEPSVLRWPRPMPRRAFHYLSMYLGPQVARQVAFACPFLLTKQAGQMRRTLPALLNVLGSKRRLAEIAVRYPMLMHVPVGDFYKGMASMTAVCGGDPEVALEVGKEAMEEIALTPHRSEVPEGYPAVVAIFGGLEEAKAAIDREPLLLKWWGEQFLGKLATLRRLLGHDGAQKALQKAPYLLLHENQRKSRKFFLAFSAMEQVFGTEGTRRRVLERPELLTLGICLKRALHFAEMKMGSREAVRKDFENVLVRTGLAEHLVWERKPRPRRGYWSPKTRLPRGYPPNSCSWSPEKNVMGRAGVARGQWDEDDPDLPPGEVVVDAELQDA